MTTPNPAHAARIKSVDRDGNITYVVYQNGWRCLSERGRSLSLSSGGFPDRQVAAVGFALKECQSPAEVLAACQRYGVDEYTLEGEAPSLHTRLLAMAKEARDEGYLVLTYTPFELAGIDRDAFERHLLLAGRTYIAAQPED